MKKLILCTLFLLGAHAYSQSSLKSLTDFVKDWIGAPYRFGGDDRSTGIDCSAFVQRLYKDVYNAVIPRTCYYQFQEMEKIELSSIIPGDLLFFKSRLSPSGWHVGVYIGNNEFVHSANRKEGVKISCLADPIYNGIIRGAGRPKQQKSL